MQHRRAEREKGMVAFRNGNSSVTFSCAVLWLSVEHSACVFEKRLRNIKVLNRTASAAFQFYRENLEALARRTGAEA